jgi:hypothetical protein
VIELKRTDRKVGKLLFYGASGIWLIYAVLLLFSPWQKLLLVAASLVMTGLIAGYFAWIGRTMMAAIKLEDD